MFVGEGDQAEVVWECINISDENVESIANRTDEILRQQKSPKRVKKFQASTRHTQVKYLTRSRFRVPDATPKTKSILDCPNNCGSSFFHKLTLEKHLKFCGQPLRYKCPYCDMSSRIRNNLNIHIKARHPHFRNYVIDTCIGKTEPPFEEDFNASQIQHVEPTWNEEHEIKILSVSSLAKSADIKHEYEDVKDDSLVRSPRRSQRFECPHNCGGSFKNEYTLKAHLELNCNKHRSESTLGYDQQNSFHLEDDGSDFEGYNALSMDTSKFEKSDELLNPMATGESILYKRTPDGRWACPNNCGGSFSSRGNMNFHVRTNCGKEPKFECPYCRHRMKQASNGFTHVKNHHPGSEVCLVNTDTGEVIRRKSDLMNEQRMCVSNSSAEVPVTRRSSSSNQETTCHSCGKEFKFGYTLTRHLGEGCIFPPRFKCPYCEYQVRRLSYAFFHITKNHPGQEVYMVDLVTGNSITDPSQIKKEAIEHVTDEDNQLAPNPAFVSRPKKVVKTHPGGLRKRKLVCPKGCGHYFFFRLSLQKHMRFCKRNSRNRKSTFSARFKCPYCEHRYGHRSSIFRHIKSRHPKHRKYAIDTQEEEVAPEDVGSNSVGLEESKTQERASKSPDVETMEYNDLQVEETEEDSASAENSKVFPCPNKCGSTFEHSFNVNRHIRDNCPKARRFKCPQCNYRSQKFLLMGKHIRTNHRMSKVYAIDVFSKKFIYSEPRRRPRSLNFDNDEKEGGVESAESSTSIPKTPVRKTQPKKPFPCPNNCGSSFALERYVETHLRLICGKAPRYKCPYCPQICRHQGNITVHIKHRHPGKRNYMIDTLKKKSDKVSSDNLQKVKEEPQEEEDESEELQNLDEAADEKSQDLLQPPVSNLPTRRRTTRIFNSRKRRIECPHKCGRCFQSVTKLKLHTKAGCKRAPTFKCPYCSKVCKHSWNFDMHIKYRHPEYAASINQKIEPQDLKKENEAEDLMNETDDLMNGAEDKMDGAEEQMDGADEQMDGTEEQMDRAEEQIGAKEAADESGSLKGADVATDELDQGMNFNLADEVEDLEDDNNDVENVEMDVAKESEEAEIENIEEVDLEEEAEIPSSGESTSVKKFLCPNDCGKSYINYSSLKSHLNYSCHKTSNFKCPYCDKCSKESSDGYAHVKEMHPDRQAYLIDIETNKFVCGTSKEETSKSSEIEDLQQEDVVPMESTVANKDAGTENLELMDESNDEFNHPDQSEEYILGTEMDFGVDDSEISKKSSAEEKEAFVCPNNCGSSFNQEQKLTNHIRDQCGPPRYKCPYCFFITRLPSNVYTHIKKKHPDERIYMIDTDMNQSYDESGSPPLDDEN